MVVKTPYFVTHSEAGKMPAVHNFLKYRAASLTPRVTGKSYVEIINTSFEEEKIKWVENGLVFESEQVYAWFVMKWS